MLTTYGGLVKMIQIRNVPDDVHRDLKLRAAREGTTMSELILGALPTLARNPTPAEVLERLRNRPTIGGPASADLVREGRERA